MKIKARITAMLCAALMLLSMSGCGSSIDDYVNVIPESTAGTDIQKAPAQDNVISLNRYTSYSLNPLIATNHSNQLICSLVYENMVEVDNNFDVFPNLISEWYCSDEGKTWEFIVAEGRTFHDGTPVSGRDLRFSLEKAINSDRYSGRFAAIQGIAFTETKMVVYLGIGDTQFVKLLNIPVIKSGTYADKYPEGSGPYTYVFEEPEPEQTDETAEGEDAAASTKEKKAEDLKPIMLTAYEGYPEYDRIPVKEIYLKEYTDAVEIIDAFEDSYIDITLNDPSSYSNLGYASTNEFRTYATTNMHYVGFNEESTYGRYSNFRVAMEYAFDRNYLVELLDGNAVATTLPMYPTCADYPQDLADTITYDLDKTLLILDNFGINDCDGDGKLEFMSGDEVSINFILCADSSAKSGVVQRFVSDMKAIGIKVNVYSLTWAKFVTALEEGVVGVEVNTDKTEPWDMFYSEVKLRNNFDLTELLQVRDEDNEYSNINYTRSKDTTYLNYINDYLSSADADRAFRYEALCKYLTDNASLITIGFEKQQLITHRGVIKGMDPNAGNPMYNLLNWTIDLD